MIRKICLVVLVSVYAAIVNSNTCSAQVKSQEDAPEQMIIKLVHAQKKEKIVQVTLKNGERRWGRATDVSARRFLLSSPAADGSNIIISFRYDQVSSVQYEVGRSGLVRRLKDIVTAPIVITVFTIWGIQGYRC